MVTATTTADGSGMQVVQLALTCTIGTGSDVCGVAAGIALADAEQPGRNGPHAAQASLLRSVKKLVATILGRPTHLLRRASGSCNDRDPGLRILRGNSSHRARVYRFSIPA